MRILVISSFVSTIPEEIRYSFVFDEIERLARRGLKIFVIRSRKDERWFTYSNRIYFYNMKETKIFLLNAFKDSIVGARYYPHQFLMKNYFQLLRSYICEKRLKGKLKNFVERE